MRETAVYLDHNATTALDARVLAAMLPFMQSQHGNPTSRHSFGRTARQAIDHAREQVAACVGAHTSQVVFTCGGTEADNLAIQGIAATQIPTQIAISAIEHPAVTKPAQALQWRGWKLAKIAVDSEGALDLDHLEHSLQQKTALVSVMAANNETGTLQDIAAIADLARRHGALFHTDAVQALGKMELDFGTSGAHAMSLSAHKINGPQGAGALIVDKSVDIQPLLYGGGQEKGLRSGSENVASIIGFGLACELALQELSTRNVQLQALRAQLERGLLELGATIFGEGTERLPNTSFFAFPKIDGETLVMALDRKGFAVASGSACSSDSPDPSHVLLAMGVDAEIARCAVRISLGAGNTPMQVEQCLQSIRTELHRLKQMAAIAV